MHQGTILRMLRDDGPQSRAELARRSSLSATALTRMTMRLLENGSVRELEQPTNGGVGRPAIGLALVPEAYYVAGVHIGAGTIQAVVVDLRAQVQRSSSFYFDPQKTDPGAVIERVTGMVEELIAQSGVPRTRLLGIGLGVPGPVDTERRRNLLSINYNWKNIAFADELEAATGMPVVVEHNVSAMALAESRYGIGRDATALLYIYLRTGLGAGLVVDGKPFRPGGHGAVELGHIQVVENGERCACGSTGCLETFLSERVLSKAAGIDTPNPRNLIGQLRNNQRAWEDAVKHLTTAIASAANLLNPDLIVFGGHLADAPEHFFDLIRQGVSKRVLPPMREGLRFERSSLGDSGGAVGGAAVALDRFFYTEGQS